MQKEAGYLVLFIEESPFIHTAVLISQRNSNLQLGEKQVPDISMFKYSASTQGKYNPTMYILHKLHWPEWVLGPTMLQWLKTFPFMARSSHLVRGLRMDKNATLSPLKWLFYLFQFNGQVSLKVLAQGHAGMFPSLAASKYFIITQKCTLIFQI